MSNQSQDTSNQSNSVEINADSYIWRPWLATWTAGLVLTRATAEIGDSESSSDFVSGQARLNMFPKSHFPGMLFLDRSDSSLDDEFSSSGYINTRFGASQLYQPPLSGSSYRGNIERNIQENTLEGTEDVTDILQLSATKNWGKHRFQGSLIYRDAERSFNDEADSQFAFNGMHNLRINPQLAIENIAEYNVNQRQTFNSKEQVRSDLHLSSATLWSDLKKPLRLKGVLDYRSSTSEAGGSESSNQVISVDGFLDYDLSEALRIHGSLTNDIGYTDDSSSLSMNQSLSYNYAPDSFDLGSFRYSWSNNGRISHQLSTEDDGDWTVGAGASHNINRNYNFSSLPTLYLSVAASQGFDREYRKTIGLMTTLNHTASLNLVNQTREGASTFRLAATDIYITGATNLHTQVVGLSATHYQALGRHANISVDFNSGVSLVSSDEGDSEGVSSSVRLTYANQRFFKIRGLRFQSKLEMDASDYLPFDLSSEDALINWRNEWNYTIGLLDTRLVAEISESENGKSDKSIFISTRRRF